MPLIPPDTNDGLEGIRCHAVHPRDSGGAMSTNLASVQSSTCGVMLGRAGFDVFRLASLCSVCPIPWLASQVILQ